VWYAGAAAGSATLRSGKKFVDMNDGKMFLFIFAFGNRNLK